MGVEISSKCSLLPPTHHFSTATENDRGDTGRGEFASSNGRKRGRGDWWRLLPNVKLTVSTSLLSRFICPPHNFPPQDPGKSLNRNESAGGYEVGDRAQAGEASLQPPDGNVDFGKAPSVEVNPFHPSSGTAGVREGEIRVGRGRWGDRREGGGV